MTEEEADAGAMRLIRKYDDIKRKNACVRDRLHELARDAEAAAISLMNMNGGDYEKTKAKFDAVDWSGISNTIGDLAELKMERKRIDGCLREAGLDGLLP